MRPIDFLRPALLVTALASTAAAVAAADPSSSDVTKSLQTIKAQADAVASARGESPNDLRDAARTIGVEWQKVEPAVAKDYLVETRFANQSITAFERDWHDSNKVRTDAKDVSSKVAQLLTVQRQNATPEPSASPSGSPSP